MADIPEHRGDRLPGGFGMKQLIVLAAMIMLGAFLFGLIAGKENSVYSTVRGVFEKQTEQRMLTDDPYRRP